MADETPQEEPERHQFMSPHTRNLLVGTAIAVILLTITAWAGSVRTERARREMLAAGVSALAASLKYPMLEAGSVRSTAGRERLDPIALEIAKAGNYAAVYIADKDGAVLATTEGGLARTKLDEKALPTKGARITEMKVGLLCGAPIRVGDSLLGFVFVETKG